MKKRYVMLLLIGLLFIICPYFFNIYSFFRILFIAIGILLITLSLVFKDNKNILLIILMPIILFVLSYGIDTFLFYKFNRIPLYVKMVESSENVKTYNSFFYRIYDCNGILILDYNYEKQYACSSDDLDLIDINEFLREPTESYIKYKNKFVKINGKISRITGVENIELSLYTFDEYSLNGYVDFNTNYIVQVETNESLSNFRVYDNIMVIGRVDKLEEKNGTYKVILKDTKLLPSDIYNSYSFEIVSNDNKELIPLINDTEYYLCGISSLNVKYDENNIYELSYLITDSRITWDILINDKDAEILKIDDQEILKKYVSDKFNLVDCSDGKKIFVNKNFKIDESICLIDIDDG